MTFEEARRLSLAIQSCVMQLNRYKRSATHHGYREASSPGRRAVAVPDLVLLCVGKRHDEALAHGLGVAHEGLHGRVGTLACFEL